MKPPCAGHCNDPNRWGARYASRKGWLCERCWSKLESVPKQKHTMIKKPAKKAYPVPKAPAKKVAPKLIPKVPKRKVAPVKRPIRNSVPVRPAARRRA